MSGIFGAVCRTGGEAALTRELRLLDTALVGHGASTPPFVVDGAALGRRAREDAAGPLVWADRQRVLVFDGQLGNRGELARDCRANSRASDVELVAAAFERWGSGFLRRLAGGFALGLWDEKTRRLFMARSPFAAPPLVWAEKADVVAFASAPKALLALGWMRREIDLDHLADHLALLVPRPGTSFFRGVRVVPPGHLVRVDDTGVASVPYWSIEGLAPLPVTTAAEAAELAGPALDDAVATSLRSPGPVTIMLSGGLDSTSLAASVAEQVEPGRPVHSFTEVPSALDVPVPPRRYLDEWPLVTAFLERHPGITGHTVTTDQLFLDGLDSLFDAAEQPLLNAANRMWLEACLRGAAEVGATTMLSGVGGNLTVGTSGAGLAVELGRHGRLLAAVRAARASTPQPSRRRALLTSLRCVVPEVVDRLRVRQTHGWSPVHSTPLSYSLMSRSLMIDTGLVRRSRKSGQNFELVDRRRPAVRRWSSLHRGHSVAGLHRGWEELFGVHLRQPLIDQRLAELTLRLPLSCFVDGPVDRALQRAVMRDRLPAEVLEQRLRGLQAAGWMRTLRAHRSDVEDTIEQIAGSPLASYALDVPRLRRLWACFPDSDEEAARHMLPYRSMLERTLMVGRFLSWAERH